ncbi:hypothetical protein Mag101_07270 [Microbulbifer agarilyticus]|uniref:Uncharacterized protein n=1 Tax=Microbulbifer agarilyticus TaxID=260552 RepID=A0A1Q2M4J2_9GAMM|nr:hypothetical protein [Microbulbifer agarilyticus]AQQ67458.1 hypothetical protein Mag101_07270 [Microbulbifer agarilyticus]
MAQINIEDGHPLRRNLIVICLIILVYILGGGEFKVGDSGSTASLGIIGVTLKHAVVVELAALLIFFWSWYRYQVFDKSVTDWSRIQQYIREVLRTGGEKSAILRAMERNHSAHFPEPSTSPYGVATGSLGVTVGAGGFWSSVFGAWRITSAPLAVNGRQFIQTQNFNLGWQEYPAKMRLLFRAMYSTEYLPSVALPKTLVFVTLLAILSPSYAYAYDQFGVLYTVGANALLLFIVYRGKFSSWLKWLSTKRPTEAGPEAAT